MAGISITAGLGGPRGRGGPRDQHHGRVRRAKGQVGPKPFRGRVRRVRRVRAGPGLGGLGGLGQAQGSGRPRDRAISGGPPRLVRAI